MAEKNRRTSRTISNGPAAARQRTIPVGVWLIGGFSVVAILLVVLFAMANQRPAAVSSDYSGIPAQWVERNRLGSPDAPVVVEMWEDYRCPACGQWTQTVKPQIMDEVEAGTVRIEFNHFPLSQHEPGASTAAQASECAADQGAFWPYHDRLFQAQNQGASAYSAEKMIEYADELGLDNSSFTQCLVGQQYLETVRQSGLQAVALGLNSTPSILVNGQRFDNPMDGQLLQEEIARLAAAADGS